MPDFQHLSLVRRHQGKARLSGHGKEMELTKQAKANRAAHSNALKRNVESLREEWKVRYEERQKENLPILPSGVPFLLKVDPSLDLEDFTRLFGLEIVTEQEDGFVIVATQDLEAKDFLRRVNEFAEGIRGSGNAAKIHSILSDPDRLNRILTPVLKEQWPFEQNQKYICDLGIECVGNIHIPSIIKRRKKESDAQFNSRQEDWNSKRNLAYSSWDDLMSKRTEEVSDFIESYDGVIHRITNDGPAEARLPDSFTVRVEVAGKGLNDFVLNYPFLFEVSEPDDIDLPQHTNALSDEIESTVELVPPSEDAATVCVIDSGIQEDHELLTKAIDKNSSYSYLPAPNRSTDIADYVRPSGHGTRVAGAILYSDEIPNSGTHQLICWLQNARILNEENKLPSKLLPPSLLRTIITKYHNGSRSTRIFNQSINGLGPCKIRHMSAWAAEIDYLSYVNDILVIQSAGNLSERSAVPSCGIIEHLEAGRSYPDYLCEDSSRIANPSQSLNALTVGSVGYGQFTSGDLSSFAKESGWPSAFSRSGFGIWKVIKPEVVEFGGDYLRNNSTPVRVSFPSALKDCCPNLVRSTQYPPGPSFDRDAIGTSFSTPKVSRIAALLQNALPNQSCLLYRALIVQSARWPRWALEASSDEQAKIIRWIGYGIPDAFRATTNDDFRTTLITDEDQTIKAGECHIYQVPIPAELRRPADEFQILVEVTLSYAASPRRTRRNPRRYLSTWLNWISNRVGESLDDFQKRAIKTEEESESQSSVFKWMLENNPLHGSIQGVKRNAGTVQKDWAIVQSNNLPEDFCIAIVGHEGWDSDPESSARYALSVSFEVIGKEIPIYESLQIATEELRAELSELENEIELPG